MSETEVVTTAESMIKDLGPLVERNPQATIKGDDFNALLKRARAAFPGSQAIRDLNEIDGVTTLADLLGKLSVIQGAARATFAERSYEAVRRHNEEQKARWSR